ncbi:MAG: ester cyclase [Phycisphaerales bacterium]|nr:MAG: ester cyclase [Phycisphaerales bacterium]
MVKHKRIALLSVIGLLAVCPATLAQTEEELLAVRQAFADALDAHDLDLLLATFTDDGMFDFVPEPAPFVGKDQIRAFFEMWYTGSPDMHGEEGRVFAADNMVVVEHAVVGTQTGPLGELPPSAQGWTYPHIDIFEIEGDKIKKLTTYGDSAGVYVQLGVQPAPEMPALVPSFTLPDAEPTGLAGLEAGREGIARWNSHDLEHYAKMLHPDCRVFAGPLGMELDRDAWVAMSEMYFQVFTGAHVDVVREVDLGEGWVVADGISTSVQNGPYFGLPPSGRDMVVRLAMLMHFDADGLLTYMGYYFDNLTLVAQITAVTPVDPGSEGLVASYALDGDATDGSGNGLDGAIVGDPVLIDGVIGGAMEFDGDGDTIEVTHDAALDITGAISLSLWIRPDAEDPEGQGTETAPMAKALSTASPSWSWQVRYGWFSPQPNMAFTFNTSPRAWAYVGQNLEQGEWHHIACSADGETLTAYLNGQATESTPMGAITGSPTPVLIGSDGWGSDWIGGIDEVRIYNRALSAGEILFLTGYMADVTAPGDLVQGVPDDGDWPAAETPDLAIDDNVETKYLHFKGDFDPDAGPTGFRVKPSVGPTVVTGISFTTANDVPGRDPIAFELYGSNGSIDGPYTLMASRDIVDFAQEQEWPRFTKNATPIVLANDTAYTYYQVLITAIRGPVGGSVNSMQIAEVELFGMPLTPPPDVEANKASAQRIFDEIWNQGNLDAANELIAPDLVRVDPGNPDASGLVGVEGFKMLVAGYQAAFPDIQFTVDDMIAEDDMVVTRWTSTGTHLGELMGIPPTGATVTGTGISLVQWVDGKMQTEWVAWDTLALLQQLGVVTPPRPAPEDYAWLPGSPLTGDPGDPETNKTMVTRFVEEVWNQKNLDPIVELFHPETAGTNPSVDYLYLPYMPNTRDEGFTQSVADYLAAYPDMYVTVHKMVAEGDKVLAYWTVDATHGGELAGIPATGNPVTFSGHTMYRFADGQIVDSWWAWDTLGMMQQITPTEAGE